MSKPKPQTVQTPFQQTSTYQYLDTPDTPDIQAVRDAPTTPDGLQPSLQAQFDRNKEKVRNRMDSSYNANIPQAVRENTRLQANRDLSADYGTALAEADYNRTQSEFAKKLAIADLTKKQLVQTGSSGYNTQAFQPQSSGFWGQLAGGVATGAIMA